MNTTLASSIEAVEPDKERYDAVCKSILAERYVLAWIIKTSLSAYTDESIEDIANKYIQGEPQIAAVSVMPNETNATRIKGTGVEDVTINEGKVTFDIFFTSLLPDTEEEISIYINVEAQDDYNPGYPLIKRALYYCARMLSSQYGVDFVKSDYDKIKKVCSIWVCTNAPKYRQNTVTKYKIKEENIIGGFQEQQHKYDLLEAVMICLGDYNDGDDKTALKLLNAVFSGNVEKQKKKQLMEEEFAIPMTQKTEDEVEEMCNLSNGVERRGREAGRIEGMVEAFASLVKENKMSMLEAAQRAGISVERFAKLAGMPVN